MATYRRNSISRLDDYVQDSSASIRSTALSEIEMSLLRGPAQDQQQGEQQLKRKINRKTGYSGAYNSIIIAMTTITIPFLALTGVLLYLVLHHRVEHNSAVSLDLQLPTDRLDSSAYYVDFSATKLTTIASWISSIAGFLPGCIMTILSYHLAKLYKQQSQKGDFDALPTPYQVALLIETFDGKLTSLWNGLNYYLWKRRANVNFLLRLAFPFLVISLILSYLIWAADTWLHVTASSIQISRLSPSLSPLNNFGYAMPTSYGSPDYSLDAYQIMNNVFNYSQILTSTQNGSRFSFLAPSNPPPDLDFTTSSFAVSSSCQPLSQQCQLGSWPPGTDSFTIGFNCSSNFQGYYNFSGGPPRSFDTLADFRSNYSSGDTFYSMGYFSTLWNTSEINSDGVWPPRLDTTPTNDPNSVFAGILVYLDVFDLGPLENDPEIFKYSGTYLYLLGCNFTFYDLTYSWTNNTITAPHLISDFSVAFTAAEGFASSWIASAQLSYTAISTTLQSNSSSQIAANYAPALENMLLTYSASTWEPIANKEEQVRQPLLVARIPKAPLFTLILLCLLFVVLGLALFVIALGGQSAETREVQVRLNVFGMTASRFEKPEAARVGKVEDLFKERNGGSRSTRVGMQSKEEGWAYVSSREEAKS